MAYGFTPRFMLGGGAVIPPPVDLIFKDTETLTAGDMVNLESGEVDLAVTTDAKILGAAAETVAGTDSTTSIKCYTDPNIVYGVDDANARVIGATLDIAGTTGAQTVAASSNKEFVVVRASSATEETLVIINRDAHPFVAAQ